MPAMPSSSRFRPRLVAQVNYDDVIEARVLDSEGNPIEGENVFALLNDLPGAYAAGKFRSSRPRTAVWSFPVTGMGLWGPIWGYVALEKDMNTIAGIIMAHKGETPGLGAEIATAKYQSKFIGKQIFNGEEFVSVKLRKGGSAGSGARGGRHLGRYEDLRRRYGHALQQHRALPAAAGGEAMPPRRPQPLLPKCLT